MIKRPKGALMHVHTFPTLEEHSLICLNPQKKRKEKLMQQNGKFHSHSPR